ncbi:hypothetical protein [Nonomuraea dietziae]|uniref:hypothetical protein n=1 Tax=Nonomuraea dietziae TaxID=65515 RepID=UPI0033CFA224
MQVDAVLVAILGMVASLAGVGLGGMVTRRTYVRQWSRERLTSACLVVVSESSRLQIALNKYRQGSDRPDWIVWNEALATLTLTAKADLVHAAVSIDEAFWRTTHAIETDQVRSADAWDSERSSIEHARLMFINLARRELADRSDVVTRIASRPALPAAHEADAGRRGTSAVKPTKS